MVTKQITLAIDSSSQTLSAALLKGENVVIEAHTDTCIHHTVSIISFVESILKASGVLLQEVDLFSIITGPGSFTGLRVGISTVKGFAYAYDKPVAAVSSLFALAHNIEGSTMPICVMIDAKQSMVYAALYQTLRSGVMTAVTDELAVKPAEFLSTLSGDILFLGNGVRMHASLIKENYDITAHYTRVEYDRIQAGIVGLIGLKKFNDGDIVNTMTLAPRYLRSSYAEVNDVVRSGRI